MPIDRYRAANRARWDETVAIHAASEFYGVEQFLKGERTIPDIDLEALGGADGLQGKSLIHLQCHFGLDTLSLARLGARVTGVDFSPQAIAQAHDLASQAGLTAAHFVESELYDAPQAVVDRFDLAFVNIGALCWLPDIRGWAQVCADFLKDGGMLYVRDVHPLLWSLDDEDPRQRAVIRYPYFESAEPLRLDDDGDYADQSARIGNTESYEWNHSLGEIVSAVIDAGLRLEWLREHTWTEYQALPWAVRVGPRLYRLPESSPQLPLQFSLRARKQ